MINSGLRNNRVEKSLLKIRYFAASDVRIHHWKTFLVKFKKGALSLRIFLILNSFFFFISKLKHEINKQYIVFWIFSLVISSRRKTKCASKLWKENVRLKKQNISFLSLGASCWILQMSCIPRGYNILVSLHLTFAYIK